jgi:hypothetical protein
MWSLAQQPQTRLGSVFTASAMRGFSEEDAMQTFETSLHYRLVRLGDSDPLTKPMTFVDYMLGAFADCAHEESL